MNELISSIPARLCAKGWPYGWSVPLNTVISIETYPKTKRTLSDLQIEVSKYKRNDRPETERVIYYNDEDGITIETESNQQIKSIQYLPVNSDKHLRCPDSAAREESIEKGESAYLTPELYYFDVSQHEQRVRLDYFAERLNKHALKSIVYVFGYAGRRSCAGEARERANWAKNYLVKRRNIPASRIRTLDGGHRDDLSVELFIVAPGRPSPLPSPTIYPQSVQRKLNCPSRRYQK